LDGLASVFSATGGGTISATNIANKIGNTVIPTTTALNVTNTTIGASGLVFQKISSSTNTVNNIILNNTGSSGGLSILGTGTTAGTGGTISQNSAGAADGSLTDGVGLYLNNTSNLSLANMNFTGTFGNFAIRGDVVNNFTLKESNFTGVYGTTDAGSFLEGAIRFGSQGNDGTGNGLTGTAFFTGNNIAGTSFADILQIYNNSAGSLAMTVNDGTNQAIFGLHSTTNGNDALFLETRGPANGAAAGTPGGTLGGGFNLTLTVNGVEFKGARGDMIQVIAASNTQQNITITNNTFYNVHTNIAPGGGGITLGGGGNSSNYRVTYTVSGNAFTGAKGTPLYVNYSGQGVSASGVILNNTIGTPNGVFNTGQSQVGSSGGGNGISVGSEKFSGSGTLNHAVRIEGNNIADLVFGVGGIALTSNTQGGGSERLEATVRNNIVRDMDPNQVAAFYAIVGGAGAGDNGQMGLNLIGNTFNNGGATNGENAIFLDQASTTARYYMPGYAGPANGGSAAMSSFLIDGAHVNILTNGGFPTYAGGGVNAAATIGATGSVFVLPVP
jgi:hypothetical protein